MSREGSNRAPAKFKKPSFKKQEIPFSKMICMTDENGEIFHIAEPKTKVKWRMEYADDIYEIIANGGSIRKIAAKYEVSLNVAWKWLIKDMDRYREAVATRASINIESMFLLTDDLLEGKIDTGSYKAICDTFKWLASKEGLEMYRDKGKSSKTTNAVQTNYVNFLQDETDDEEIKEVTYAKEE